MSEDWQSPQNILVILAHPDDPEFFCGASIARWTAAGHRVSYWLLTCGDKGAQDAATDPNALCSTRFDEQRAAAAVLGVTEVNFLGRPDGYLVPDLELRKDVTRIIRKERPDVLVTCDPRTLFFGDARLNHPDHRAAGQVVLDAVFPAAGNPLYFPELLHGEGLQPHSVREVWCSLTLDPNVRLDVTDLWETKLRALYEHKSQIGEPQALAARMRARHTSDSTPEAPRYEETFHRTVYA
ncbi:MAG: PIG-L deacetylase family protein [Chloroflexota bacterium]